MTPIQSCAEAITDELFHRVGPLSSLNGWFSDVIREDIRRIVLDKLYDFSSLGLQDPTGDDC